MGCNVLIFIYAIRIGKIYHVYDFKYDGGCLEKDGTVEQESLLLMKIRLLKTNLSKIQLGFFSVDDLADDETPLPFTVHLPILKVN